MAGEAKDERSWAIVQGKIADILYAKGELDEAMRIRKEEELPVYERLGDVRSTAVLYWGIAQLHMAKDELVHAAEYASKTFTLLDHLEDLQGLSVVDFYTGNFCLALGTGRKESRWCNVVWTASPNWA
jgi:hypothetical protein